MKPWRPRYRLLIVTLVLAASATTKLLKAEGAHAHAGDPAWFRAATGEYTLQAIASTELVLAVMLWTRLWKPAAIGSVALFTAFLVFVARTVRAGLAVEQCGCFGDVKLSAGSHVALLMGVLLLLFSCLVPQGRMTGTERA